MIRDLDFSPDGRFLVSSSFDKTVRIWRMRDGFSKVLEDKSAFSFYSVKFNPDRRYIAAGNEDGMLRIWHVQTSQLVEKWTAHGKVVRSVVFTLDGKGLVSSSGDGTWKYWDISLLELTEPGYGKTKDTISTARQISEVMAHTVRYSHVPVRLFLLTQVYTSLLPCPSAYRTMSIPLPSLLIANGLFLAQLIKLCISGTCTTPPGSAP